MCKTIILTTLIVLFLEMLLKKIITLKDIKDWSIIIFKGIVERYDKMLTGNDGFYSHTRFINIWWGIGSFSLICLCVLRSINIQSEILILMGGAIGISAIQAVKNKIQEVKSYLGDKDNGQDR